MKKFLILTILISALLLLSGCAQKSTTSAGYYKYTGANAIEAKFLKDSPVSSEVDTYQKKENIEVVVELVNRLTEDIAAGQVKVRLTGDAAIPAFFEGAKEISGPKLDPIDPETGIATPEEVELGPIRYVGDLTTKTSKKLTAQYCYSAPVKIKANLFYTNKETEVGTNLPSGSNPPSAVQVAQVQQGTVNKGADGNGELRFKVTVKNVGKGTVISGLDECFKYRERTSREELKLEAKGAYAIECGDGIVRLSRTDESRIMDCKVTGIDMTNLGKDASELSLTLKDFAYEDEIAPVTIWLEQ